MSSRYRTIIDIIIWILFLKGLVLIPITIYLSQLYLAGQAASTEPIASCAAGTLAFAMSCAAIFIRNKIQ